MKKNLLKIYESFFDDLDKLNKDDGFRGTNDQVYDQHNYILSPYKNPEFFYDLCDFCKDYYPDLPSNENGFTQNDLDKIIHIDSTLLGYSYFKKVTSLDELQYFHNLKEIYNGGFYNCKIKSIIFPENIQILRGGCFSHCTSLEKLNFPDSIKEIYRYSFNYCISLKEIIIPENIEILNDFAFKNCFSLKKIVIPKIFKYLIEYIFDNDDLSKVNITYI